MQRILNLPAASTAASLGAIVLTAVPAFAHPSAELGILAHADVLPIAIILGAGVLTWLLGNRRPQLEPARPRKPEPTKRRRRPDR